MLRHQSNVECFKKVKELSQTLGKVQSSLPLATIVHPILSVLCLLLVILLNGMGIFSVYEAASICVIALLVTDTMSWRDVVNAIPGNLMIMIAYSFALAAAMRNSGLGVLIGEGFARSFVGHPYVQLMGLYLCTTVLTAIAPNSATASIMYPIAVTMSAEGGFSLLAGVYCLAVASSADFLTPFGYQCNLMVQKPGNYSFMGKDFVLCGCLTDLAHFRLHQTRSSCNIDWTFSLSCHCSLCMAKCCCSLCRWI